MTFSGKTKNELSRMELKNKCCAIAELSAIVRMNGSIQLSGTQQINVSFSTENAAIARRIFSILKLLYEADIQVRVRRNTKLKKNNNYLIVVNDRLISKRIIEDVGFLDDKSSIFSPNYSIPKHMIDNRCCRRSYIRGAFLGGGSISNPEKTYHIEFVTDSQIHAEDLSNLINSFNLESKIVLRKDNYVIYLKEANQISDLLNIIGAHQALLKMEDIRILKDIRNNINRLVNCETANLSKTIDAAVRQLENILYIDEKIGINKLPNKLREVAELRIENQDLSLKEIGELMNPPVGKSGVNHRFRKIDKIADDLKEGKDLNL